MEDMGGKYNPSRGIVRTFGRVIILVSEYTFY